MTGGIDQVDQEITAFSLLADNVLDILLILELTEQRDGSGLDGNTTLLLVGTSICCSGVTSLGSGNDTSLGQQGVGQGRLAVIDVGNDGHVADIGGLVHQLSDLVNREAIMMKASVSKMTLIEAQLQTGGGDQGWKEKLPSQLDTAMEREREQVRKIEEEFSAAAA